MGTWILEMKSSSQILRKLQWFSAASVVSVISSIDTGFALPAIADFKNLLRQNKSDSYL
jgi:hypothetical protein